MKQTTSSNMEEINRATNNAVCEVESGNQPTESKSCGEAIAVKYSKRQTDILTQWMIDHRDHPFPDAIEIAKLCEATNLSYSQVVNWTTNVRKRNLKATVEGGKKPHHFLDFLFLAQDRERRFIHDNGSETHSEDVTSSCKKRKIDAVAADDVQQPKESKTSDGQSPITGPAKTFIELNPQFSMWNSALEIDLGYNHLRGTVSVNGTRTFVSPRSGRVHYQFAPTVDERHLLMNQLDAISPGSRPHSSTNQHSSVNDDVPHQVFWQEYVEGCATDKELDLFDFKGLCPPPSHFPTSNDRHCTFPMIYDEEDRNAEEFYTFGGVYGEDKRTEVPAASIASLTPNSVPSEEPTTTEDDYWPDEGIGSAFHLVDPEADNWCPNLPSSENSTSGRGQHQTTDTSGERSMPNPVPSDEKLVPENPLDDRDFMMSADFAFLDSIDEEDLFIESELPLPDN